MTPEERNAERKALAITLLNVAKGYVNSEKDQSVRSIKSKIVLEAMANTVAIMTFEPNRTDIGINAKCPQNDFLEAYAFFHTEITKNFSRGIMPITPKSETRH